MRVGLVFKVASWASFWKIKPKNTPAATKNSLRKFRLEILAIFTIALRQGLSPASELHWYPLVSWRTCPPETHWW